MKENKGKAISLRKQGKGYNEISKILNAPKSTLSGWLRDVEMLPKIKEKFLNETRNKWAENIIKFNKKRAEIAKEKAREAQNAASKDIGKLSKRELFLVGVALYWAEGRKKSRWCLTFSNSDSEMIKLMMEFFRKICGVKNEFSAAVQIHPNVTSQEAVNYWSKIAKIPKSQFIKTYSRVTSTSKRKRAPNILPYGTFRISISRTEITNK